jgi:GNAT superfamily N-acetyltransferase
VSTGGCWPDAGANRAALIVRPAVAADTRPLLALMRQLAVFEGYAAQFAVTEADLLVRGFSESAAPQFHALVVEGDGEVLLGYAAVYLIPFTFDLRPILVLKELFVAKSARGGGVGAALMRAVIDRARAEGCGRVKWSVLPENEDAKAFYRCFGATEEVEWQPWVMALDSGAGVAASA